MTGVLEYEVLLYSYEFTGSMGAHWNHGCNNRLASRLGLRSTTEGGDISTDQIEFDFPLAPVEIEYRCPLSQIGNGR